MIPRTLHVFDTNQANVIFPAAHPASRRIAASWCSWTASRITPSLCRRPPQPRNAATDWWTTLSTDPQNAIPDDNAPHMARATIVQGDQTTPFSDPVTIQFSGKGPTLDSVEQAAPVPDLGVQLLTLRFSGNQLNSTAANSAASYSLKPVLRTQPRSRPTRPNMTRTEKPST